ncbi:hypothetical protein ACL02O_22055 [Micromonospora sp. MS34]|uniref:hypothetical protein n=1 Tax=Micromonospora sp. MS34 TaxID=3385971 RepID=UPI00399FC7C2
MTKIPPSATPLAGHGSAADSSLGGAGILRLSGFALVLSGLLAGAAAVLQATAWPPSTSAGLPMWVDAHHATLALIDECLVIGAALLAVGVVGMWQGLNARSRPWAAAGVALMALSAPVSVVDGVIYGRLTYPAYGIDVAGDPQALALVITTWAGGAHAVSLILAVAGLAIGAGMICDRARNTLLGALGLAAGITQLLVAFPWLFPVAAVTGCQLVLTVWLVTLGASLSARTRLSLV